MPEEVAGSRANDQAGSVFQRSGSDFGAFKETLGDLGKDKSLEPIKDFQGLTKSFVESQKLLGKPIRLPDKEKKDDRKKAIDNFMNHLRSEGDLEAIPENPEKYEIKLPTEEGFQVNQPLLDSFRQIAHKTGIAPSQAQKLFDWYLNFQAEGDALSQEEFETIREGLKKEWGGLYTRRMEAARRAGGKYLGADADEIFSKIPPGIGVRFVKAFAEIGDSLVEDAIISGELTGVTRISEVKKEIDAIVANKDHPLWDVGKPGHKEAVEKWTELQQNYIKLQPKK